MKKKKPMIPARGTRFALVQSLERLVKTFDQFPTSNKERLWKPVANADTKIIGDVEQATADLL